MFKEDSVKRFLNSYTLFPSNEVTTRVLRSDRPQFEKDFQASVLGDFMSNGRGRRRRELEVREELFRRVKLLKRYDGDFVL